MQSHANPKGMDSKDRYSQLKVLIISDEPETAKVWGYSLNQVGLDVTLIGITEPVQEIWARDMPDLIIIEDFNAEIEEIELCRELRDLSAAPILYLTNKLDEAFHLRVYQSGADECIPFPVTPRLFQAKVNAWLRRTQSAPLAVLKEIRAGDFLLKPDQKRLGFAQDEPVRLSVLETRLLCMLMDSPGQAFDPQEIIERVWGYYGSGDGILLKNLIYRLRRKIEPDPNRPRYLVTSGASGYKFVPGE